MAMASRSVVLAVVPVRVGHATRGEGQLAARAGTGFRGVHATSHLAASRPVSTVARRSVRVMAVKDDDPNTKTPLFGEPYEGNYHIPSGPWKREGLDEETLVELAEKVVKYDSRFSWMDPAVLCAFAQQESSGGINLFRSEPPAPSYNVPATFSVGIGQQLPSCLAECTANGFSKYGSNIQDILGKVLNNYDIGLYFIAAYATVLREKYGKNDEWSMFKAYNGGPYGGGAQADAYADSMVAHTNTWRAEEADLANHVYSNPRKREFDVVATASSGVASLFGSVSSLFSGGGGKGGNAPLGKPGDDGADTYEVESGDNLSDIASQLSVSVADMLKVNPELAGNPDSIQIGQELRIPGHAKIPK